jgi:hypothetical protein
MLRALLLAVVVAAGWAATADARTVWLCRPGLSANPCEADRTATAVAADGSRTVERFPADRRPIDCFYVYPTVSPQPTLNATREIDSALRGVATIQASRFSSVCRVYAPVYRQVTVAGLADLAKARNVGVPLAYGDVRAAWRDYLRHDNHGRGVVLIGHSQGTGLLTRLVAEEIDGRPAVRRRLVSALLIGGNVLVPAGRDVGGSFQHVPACRSRGQVGCVVAYSSFLQTPPDPSLFARGSRSAFEAIFGLKTRGDDLQTLCVNPAAPGGAARRCRRSSSTPGPGPRTPAAIRGTARAPTAPTGCRSTPLPATRGPWSTGASGRAGGCTASTSTSPWGTWSRSSAARRPPTGGAEPRPSLRPTPAGARGARAAGDRRR